MRTRSKPARADVHPHRAKHLDLDWREIATENGVVSTLVDGCESPLAWLARRKGRDGRPMIAPEQFVAGERLRADFTRAHLAPRVTSDWSGLGGRQGSAGPGEMADVVLAARQRVSAALEACGPEFAGLLMDVCCFLRGLEDVERERLWPARSGKVVLQLALDRLARHYGLMREARGPERSRMGTWSAAP